MNVFIIVAIIASATALSGTAGAYGACCGVILANCYHVFD